MVKHRLAIAVAVASLAASAAFGYGVEGWPNGKPDHVINAQKDSGKSKGSVEGCSCCSKAASDKSSTNDERNRVDEVTKNACTDAASCK